MFTYRLRFFSNVNFEIMYELFVLLFFKNLLTILREKKLNELVYYLLFFIEKMRKILYFSPEYIVYKQKILCCAVIGSFKTPRPYRAYGFSEASWVYSNTLDRQH